MEWKSIDTAPKDGTEILVNDGCSYGIVTMVSWEEIGNTGISDWCISYTNAVVKSPSDDTEEEIFGLSNEAILDLVRYNYTPTLWCEVPKPTEEQDDAAGS